MDHHQNLPTCSSDTPSTSSAASAANAAAMTSVPSSIQIKMCDESPKQQQELQQPHQQQELQKQMPSTSSVVANAPTEDTSSASIDPQLATTGTSDEEKTANTNNSPVTDDSSDECESDNAQKPQYLRTSELVDLNSDSDSDVVFVSESMPSNPGSLQLKAIARSKIKNRSGTPHPRSKNPTSSDDDEEDNRISSSIFDIIEKEEESADVTSNTDGVESTDKNNEKCDENESNHSSNTDNNEVKDNDNEMKEIRHRKRTNSERSKCAETSSTDETDDEDADDIAKRRKYEYNTYNTYNVNLKKQINQSVKKEDV